MLQSIEAGQSTLAMICVISYLRARSDRRMSEHDARRLGGSDRKGTGAFQSPRMPTETSTFDTDGLNCVRLDAVVRASECTTESTVYRGSFPRCTAQAQSSRTFPWRGFCAGGLEALQIRRDFAVTWPVARSPTEARYLEIILDLGFCEAVPVVPQAPLVTTGLLKKRGATNKAGLSSLRRKAPPRQESKHAPQNSPRQ